MGKREDWEESDSGGRGEAGGYGEGNSYGGDSSRYSWSGKIKEEAVQETDEPDKTDGNDKMLWKEEKTRAGKPDGKKQSTGKGILIGVLIVLIPLLVLFGGSACYLKSTGKRISVVSSDGLDVESIVSKLNLIQQVIDSAFLFDYDEEELVENIYSGYLEGLGDPYTCYYTEEEYKEMMESSEGTYYGIGVMISQDVDTGACSVIRVFSGSPAQEAGIEEGDIIETVDGKDVLDTDINEVVALIKGAEGSTVEIKVYRESAKKEITMGVERRQVDVDTVYYKMLDNKIGYLELTEFDSVSTEQFGAALEDLKAQGMESLILDLRNNPGGLLDVAVDIADELIDTGLVVSIADKNGKTEEYKADTEGSLGLPLAVLVNGNSASASEVLSGCIRDYGVGTLVGTQTFGKGIVQNILPMSDGTAMKITTAHYYTPNGDDIHGKGIKPDVVVEDDAETEEVDEQLDAAVELLTR